MSNKKLTRLQEELLNTYKERRELLKPFLLGGELIDGSYAEVYQKCGRSGCHCEKEPTHLVTRLSRWVEGKLNHKVVRIPDRVWVEKLSKIYKQHKKALARLTKITAKERRLMNSIIEMKKKRYE